MKHSFRLMYVGCYLLGMLLFLGSCKSKKAVAMGSVNTSLSTKKIIQNHYTNALNFNTLSGRIKIKYQDAENDQGVLVSLRMKKNEAIWLSAPLGMFKAYITPERVSFYNKLDEVYFDGDFSYLSELLGTEMDFEKVQNLLLGHTVLDLRKDKYLSYAETESYVLKPKVERELYKILFALEPKHFRVRSQQLSQPEKNRFLNITYDYQTVDEKVAPSAVGIEAVQEAEVRSIQLDFRNLEFGRRLNFPYKIPKGFKAIVEP